MGYVVYTDTHMLKDMLFKLGIKMEICVAKIKEKGPSLIFVFPHPKKYIKVLFFPYFSAVEKRNSKLPS